MADAERKLNFGKSRIDFQTDDAHVSAQRDQPRTQLDRGHRRRTEAQVDDERLFRDGESGTAPVRDPGVHATQAVRSRSAARHHADQAAGPWGHA